MPGTTIFFLGLVGAVGALRLVEMRLSRRHQRAMAAGGTAPLPERVFPAMVALHTGVLAAAVIETLALGRPFVAALAIPAVVLVALANALRFWVIASLGIQWNVRVVASTPALGVVTSGPYRFVRHPNYVAVFVELTALPLVHGAYLTAVAGALLHAAVLYRRIGLEESVLMADESYRKAFARKPRFLPTFPWPTS
ncbi:MAG TPA: isoprenylcysteine carboxylmethyltransferase family protein [Polyangia bacterium]|nr:isoprenylcysteine carboxylmethyltransferase family protein [Polyangia bacterium]